MDFSLEIEKKSPAFDSEGKIPCRRFRLSVFSTRFPNQPETGGSPFSLSRCPIKKRPLGWSRRQVVSLETAGSLARALKALNAFLKGRVRAEETGKTGL